MNLQDALNAEVDFASLAALARRGMAWWLEELTTMLPARWRERLSSRPGVWVEPQAAGDVRLWSAGTPQPGPPPPLDGAKVGLLAPTDAVLVQEVTVPRMPAADARRMVALDIDRLSPLAPELVHFDVEIADQEEGEDANRLRVLVGIVPRALASDLLQRARAAGHEPVAFAARVGDDAWPPRFDFLPQVRAAAGEKPPGRARLYWWIGAAAMIAVNIAVLVGRDMADVSGLRAAVDAQQPAVNAILRLRQRIDREDARRRELLGRGARTDPLRMLNALTETVPQGAWVQHLEWNGQSLHIVGYKRQDIDLLAALRASPSFANPRSATAQTIAGPAPVRPFDITADARWAPRS